MSRMSELDIQFQNWWDNPDTRPSGDFEEMTRAGFLAGFAAASPVDPSGSSDLEWIGSYCKGCGEHLTTIGCLECDRALLKAAPDLLEACKLAFERLEPKGDVRKDYGGHVAMAALSSAIYKVEGGAP